LANGYRADLDAGPFRDERDYTTTQKLWLAGAGFDLKTVKGKLVLNYSIGENKRIFVDDSTSIAPTAFDKYNKSTFGGLTQFADLYWTNSLSKSFDLVVGADLRKANLEQTYVSYSSFGKYEAEPISTDSANSNIYSLYATGLVKTKSFFLEVGTRYNLHSIYGSNFTYSFNPSYLVNKNVKLFANISSAFKAPSLYQLYSPYGNKALKPEVTQSSEFGFQLSSKNQKSTFRATYFDRNQKDVIFFQSLNDFPYGKYINFDKQTDNGIEIEANSSVGKLNFWGNYTYLNGKITTEIAGKDTTFNNLFRRPKNQLNLGAGYQINGKMFVSASLKSVGERTDRFYNSKTFGTDNVTMQAYTLLDIYADYKFTKSIKAYLDLKNITDATYADSYGYSTKPFNFMVGVSLGF
jgi:vitamin B12 transporter